ncbi:MAG: carboxypeptidase-like regulatory domain-containing protein [Nitrospirae bacterium]|nr:carboxypeptidase-like regulatory domain-containing protein [Nitrospirota bacterium]
MTPFRKFFLVLIVPCVFAAALAGCKGGGNGTPPFSPGFPEFIVSGTVSGAWPEGVTIAFSSAETSTVRITDAKGDFQWTTFSAGTYSVTPSLTGYTFTPADQTIVLSTNETFTLINTMTLSNFVSASTMTSYSISGFVTYGGTYSGPNTGVYVGLWQGGQPTGRGTSIASAGTYTIRGVPAGTYTLNAEMDVLGTGTRNATDPYGTLTPLTVADNLTGLDVILSDTIVMPTTPVGLTINPGNQSAIIAWVGNYDANRKETATAYKIYWGPNAGSPTASMVVPAYGRQLYFQSIPNGTYSYLISSMVGTFESVSSAVIGPVTIGAGAGANTISGTVTMPSTTTGPLYVGVYDSSHFYFTRMDSPSTSQPYSVSGVPNGAYQSFAVVDMNNDGFLDAGDLSIGVKSAYQLLDVNNADVSWDTTLQDQNAAAYVNTNHYHWLTGTDLNEYYSLKFEVDGNKKRPVNVILYSGANVPVPLDIMRPSLINPLAFAAWVKSGVTGTAIPAAGDLYQYRVSYSDGSSEILSAAVTTVLNNDNFAQNLSVQSNPSSTVPTFAWDPPASPPASYTYALEVLPLTDSWYWLYPQNVIGMPSSVTTRQFNLDAQQGVPASLTAWTPYVWTVFVMDANNNVAQSLTSYIPH